MAIFNEQIDIAHIPLAEQLTYHPLENRYKLVLYISHTFYNLLFLSLIAVPFFIKSMKIPEWIIYLIGCFIILRGIWGYCKIFFGFKYKQYALRERDIIYQTGWLWRSSTIVPFNRVQHVSVNQGPIERKFNLSKIKIFTAGGSSSDLSIPGLTPPIANKLKDFIVRKTGQDEEE